jgi:uncharacterized protein (DUF1501 family)
MAIAAPITVTALSLGVGRWRPGGRIAGEQVRVEQATLFQNRDYPVLNEYRAVLGGLFTRMYGLDKTKLASVFPDAEAKDIGLV